MSTRPVAGKAGYTTGESSFLAGARPQDVLQLSIDEALDILRSRYRNKLELAISAEAVDLSRPTAELPEPARSPLTACQDSSWMRRANMVGVNVRTVGDYAGVVKYAMTLPRALDAIHLLPIWEPGVVESLYGIASWNLNTEFISKEWQQSCPQLDTVGKQLRAVTNLLHLMGKAVGMDVIPHTDRFSEAAVGTPSLFEWMRVVDDHIVDKSEMLAQVAEEAVFQWLAIRGSASGELGVPQDSHSLFALPEADRLLLLFGAPDDHAERIERRVDLIVHLKRLGLEPVPATMGVPFRGLVVDSGNVVEDSHGMRWPDYRIEAPGPMARVFTPLARFKLYGRIDDNANWEVDFRRPRDHVWDYVRSHYAEARHIGNFDFMRGDMSHVQMRPNGVPGEVDDYYDILAAVKTHIQAEVPWFGYFAESFLPPRDVFQYGEEMDHLEASLADATLGDLQSTAVGTPEFLQRFRRYLDDLSTRSVAPAFCVGTADKDDPRFDDLYLTGLEARFFTAMFLTDMPSYAGLGYEIRDTHREPVENERYTKLFVFKEEGDSNLFPSKARFSDEFAWGENDVLFDCLSKMRALADELLPEIEDATTRWLIPPDATGGRATAVWTHNVEPFGRHVFMVNYDTASPSGYFGVPGLDSRFRLQPIYSSAGEVDPTGEAVLSNGFFHRIETLEPGEARIYRVIDGGRL